MGVLLRQGPRAIRIGSSMSSHSGMLEKAGVTRRAGVKLLVCLAVARRRGLHVIRVRSGMFAACFPKLDIRTWVCHLKNDPKVKHESTSCPGTRQSMA